MSKQTKDWMEKLVENYRIPTEEETQKKTEPKNGCYGKYRELNTAA